jgi:hypothetical protein
MATVTCIARSAGSASSASEHDPQDLALGRVEVEHRVHDPVAAHMVMVLGRIRPLRIARLEVLIGASHPCIFGRVPVRVIVPRPVSFVCILLAEAPPHNFSAFR